MEIKQLKLYQDKEWLQKQYNELGHTRAISKKYNISEWTVDEWAKRLGIIKNPLRRMSSRTHKLNENYFEYIDSEEKAYWLGFIMADGCITKSNNKYDPNRFNLALKDSDIGHLYKLIKCIECDYEPITKLVINKKRNFESYTSELRINSKLFVNYLVKNGICMNKTGKENIPDTVPNELIKHFIRGFFDGDGSLTKNGAFRIGSSSKVILEQIIKYFHDILNIEYVIYEDNRYSIPFYTIDSRNSKHNKMVLDLLYLESSIYLDRKYEQYIRYTAPLQSDL